MSEKAFLVLETGEVFPGKWHGGVPRAGEVVLNTSHSGYEEIATDPSYFSQILVMTAPMQGNYGVDDKVWESRQFWIEGFVALQLQNSSRDQAWVQRLLQKQIPCVSEMDTRAITLRLRNGGTPWGALLPADHEAAAKESAKQLIMEKSKLEKDWVWLSSRRQIEKRKGALRQGPRIAVMDFGCKENILREAAAFASELVIFPSRTSVRDLMAEKPAGLLLTNGPGDPADVQSAPGVVKELLGQLPIFGICMGHQILGLALGAKTYKLKFGHRGSNHPIQDLLLKKVYMSSQNHGYAIDMKTLPEDVLVTQRNLNDQTVAGIYSEKRNCLGIQYHPESHPGPHDAVGLFEFFMKKMIPAGRQ